MHFYLLFDEVEVLDVLNIFKIVVEKQKKKKIKIIRLNKGNEYYGGTQKRDKC